jgi:osmoprotectant transport system substrate-binding protein
MRNSSRAAIGLLALLVAGGLAGCGKEGSSGTQAPASVTAGGCAPVAGEKLVALVDDKKLQSVDNIIAAVNTKASSTTLIAALDKVAATLDTRKLIALNKATDIDHKTPKVAAEEFATAQKLTDGIATGGTGKIIVGAANFTENQTVAEMYRIALTAAGYSVTVQQIDNRELYEPALEQGQIQVIPEYVGSLTEFLNKKVNGANATQLASGDLDKTVTALTGVATKVGLTVGKPSAAADQNAFAVTSGLAEKYSLKTLSDFASKCSGSASVLGGPAECPKRPFCQPGLESTYNIKFGQFVSLDAGGPQVKTALKQGKVSLGLVLTSDPVLA